MQHLLLVLLAQRAQLARCQFESSGPVELCRHSAREYVLIREWERSRGRPAGSERATTADQSDGAHLGLRNAPYWCVRSSPLPARMAAPHLHLWPPSHVHRVHALYLLLLLDTTSQEGGFFLDIL